MVSRSPFNLPGDRHDHRDESSTMEAEPARPGFGAGQRQQGVPVRRLQAAVVLQNPAALSD